MLCVCCEFGLDLERKSDRRARSQDGGANGPVDADADAIPRTRRRPLVQLKQIPSRAYNFLLGLFLGIPAE